MATLWAQVLRQVAHHHVAELKLPVLLRGDWDPRELPHHPLVLPRAKGELRLIRHLLAEEHGEHRPLDGVLLVELLREAELLGKRSRRKAEDAIPGRILEGVVGLLRV